MRQSSTPKATAPGSHASDHWSDSDSFDRVPTGEVFRRGLAQLREQRQRDTDPLDEYVRRVTGEHRAILKGKTRRRK